MKTRKKFWSLCMAIAMVLSMITVVPTTAFAAEKHYSVGDVMHGMVMQFYIQDNAANNYKWLTFEQDVPSYGQEKSVVMTADPAQKFAGATEGIEKMGFQLGDGNMEVGETAAVHYRLSNVVLKFKNHDDLKISKIFDDEVLWKCKSVSWGKDGNSTAIDINDYVKSAFPSESFYTLAMDLESVSFDYTLDYYEFGATEPRKKVEQVVDKVVANLGAGITISNALDQSTSKGDEITEALVDAYKAAGIKSIRIPVCFDSNLSSAYAIDDVYLEKIKDQVAIITSKGLNAILSLEVLNGWADPTLDNAELGQKHVVAVWKSLAESFAAYDNLLLFEIFAKPKAASTAVANSDINNTLSDWYKAVVLAIRETGGNNLERPIVLAPFNNLAINIAGLSLPTDKNIAVSAAVNAPYEFTTSIGGVSPCIDWVTNEKIGDIRSVFNTINKAVAENEIPVIITDFGAVDKNNYKDRVTYAYDFAKLAKEFGFAFFWNDNGQIKKDTVGSFGLVNRADNTVVFPSILDSLVAAAAEKSIPDLKEPVYPEGYATETPAETQVSGDNGSSNNNSSQTNPEQPQKNKTMIVIVAVIAAVVLIGAVIVLMVVFKKRNGSFI